MKDYSKAEEHFNHMGGNNGLAYTKNPARIWFDNFGFRSEQEVAYYQALVKRRKIKQATFLFFPLPVCAQPGSRRKEFDFLICDEGQWLRVEIDGDSHNQELAFDREASEKWPKENLIVTLRFRSYSSDNEAWADECVKETFKFIKKLKKRRYM